MTPEEAVALIEKAIDEREKDWCPCCEYCGVWPPSKRMRAEFREFLQKAFTSIPNP
jgi:hypothetical protein